MLCYVKNGRKETRENVGGREREGWLEDSKWGNGRKENKERGREGGPVGSKKGRGRPRI